MLETVSLRAHWENLGQETRRHVTDIIDQLAVEPDEPARLCTLALFDPVGQGAEILRELSRTAPLDVPDPEAQFQLGWPRSPCGPTIWRSRSSGPLPPASARTAGSPSSRRRSSSRRGQKSAQGRSRVAITAAAEGVQLAEETRQVRYVVAAQLAEAIAAVEMGADEAAERLIGAAEAALLPLGTHPFLSLVALARGRQALAHERFAEAYAHLLRIFDPNDAAYQEFVGGWALADLADAALQGDGDLERVDEFLDGWDGVATSTGAPQLELQLQVREGRPRRRRRCGAALRERDERRSAGLAPLRRARPARVRRLAPATAPHDRVAGAAARGRAVRSRRSACSGSPSVRAVSCARPARRRAAVCPRHGHS